MTTVRQTEYFALGEWLGPIGKLTCSEGKMLLDALKGYDPVMLAGGRYTSSEDERKKAEHARLLGRLLLAAMTPEQVEEFCWGLEERLAFYNEPYQPVPPQLLATMN